MKKIAVLLALTLMAAPTLSQAATAAANTINSAAIIQADGTSGQTLTTGNGVKTGHIQNAAVTAVKLAPGSVSSSKIFGQLSTSKLRVGTVAGTVAAGNHTHVINTADLAAGAVTDAKISGTIATSKLSVGTAAGTVAAGNHTHDTTYAKKYANVVVVAKSGGDFTDPIAAINSITNATAVNTWLVKIMPGVYNLGTAPLQMKPYVDVEGSGVGTVITSSRTNVDFDTCTVGTVQMANNTWLKNLMVMNTAPDAGNENLTAGVIFDNVTANMEGVKVLVGTDATYGARNAGACSTGALALATLNNVDLETHTSLTGHSNAAMIIHESSMIITNSKLASFSVAGSIHTVDCCSSDTSTGFTKVSNTTITGTCFTTDCYNQGFWVEQCATSSLRDSVVTLIGGGGGDGISAANDLNIFNSQVYTPFNLMYWGGGSAKFGFNVLGGDLSSVVGAPDIKLFDNCDANLNAIANQ